MLCASRPTPSINDAVWEGAVELGFALPRLVPDGTFGTDASVNVQRWRH